MLDTSILLVQFQKRFENLKDEELYFQWQEEMKIVLQWK